MRSKYPKPLQVGDRPITPGKANPACPILPEARIAWEKARDLKRTIRQLRRLTQRCLTCPACRVCPSLKTYHQAIETAIGDLHREWGFDEE